MVNFFCDGGGGGGREVNVYAFILNVMFNVESHRDDGVKVLDCNIIESEFELQLCTHSFSDRYP